MPHDVTETVAFTAVVPVPDPGEPIMAADLEAVAEALANRAKFLREGAIQFRRDFGTQIDNNNDGEILNIGWLGGFHTSRLVVLPVLTGNMSVTLRAATGAGGDPPPTGTLARFSRYRDYNGGAGGPPSAHTVTIGSGSESGGVDLIRMDSGVVSDVELRYEGAGFGYPAAGWRVVRASGCTYLF